MYLELHSRPLTNQNLKKDRGLETGFNLGMSINKRHSWWTDNWNIYAWNILPIRIGSSSSYWTCCWIRCFDLGLRLLEGNLRIIKSIFNCFWTSVREMDPKIIFWNYFVNLDISAKRLLDATTTIDHGKMWPWPQP